MREIGFLFGFWTALYLAGAAAGAVILVIIMLFPSIPEAMLLLIMGLLWWGLVETLRVVRRHRS